MKKINLPDPIVRGLMFNEETHGVGNSLALYRTGLLKRLLVAFVSLFKPKPTCKEGLPLSIGGRTYFAPPYHLRIASLGLMHELSHLKVVKDTRTNAEIDADMEQKMVRLGLSR